MAPAKKWQEEARCAYEKHRGPAALHERVACAANVLTLLFLLEVRASVRKKEEEAQGPCNLAMTLSTAIASLRECPCRVYNGAGLRSLKGVGSYIEGVVANNLWSMYPPDDPDSDDEQAWAELRQDQKGQKASSAAKSKKRTEAKQAQQIENTAILNGRRPSQDQAAANSSQENASPRAKAKATKAKDYVPAKGSANYAFLIVMYKGQSLGKEHFAKDELMNLAESSGLASKSIFGSGARAAPGRNASEYYTGWSCINTMLNRQDPLVHKWSNPLKICLTDAGKRVAEELYARAVGTGETPALPGVNHEAILARAAAARAAAVGVEGADLGEDLGAPVRKPAAKRSRATKKTSAATGGHGDASAAARPEFEGSDWDGADDITLGQASPRGGKTTRRPTVDAGAPAPPNHKRRKLQPLTCSAGRDDDSWAFADGHMAAHDWRGAAEQVVPDSERARRPVLGPSKHGAPQAALQQAADVTGTGRGNTSGDTGVIELLDSDDEDCGIESARNRARTLPPLVADSGRRAAAAPSAAPERPVPDQAQGAGRTKAVAAPHARARQPLEAPSAPAASAPCDAGPAAACTSRTAQRIRTGAWKLPVLTAESLAATVPGHIRRVPLPDGGRFADYYDVVLVVDTREQFAHSSGTRRVEKTEAMQAHAASLREAGLTVELRGLPVGDAIWLARCKKQQPCGPAPGDEFVLDWIVERKAGEDLVQSIKDGRYSRQKYRMSKCGLRFLMYLVEGSLDELESGSKAAKTAAVETEIFAGFQVLRSSNVHESKRLYQRMTRHIQNIYGALRAPSDADALPPLPSYARWKDHAHQSSQNTVHDVWACTLCALPGVGPELAEAVVKAYPVPLRLFRALEARHREAVRRQQDSQAECIALLANVPVNALRKVGNRAASSIYQELFQTGWHTCLE